jgi:hypothetical protein|tara:strand:+ start:8707 stop:9459 length:753 start_codon:yes stop_codon:yes gene_type:complete
MASVQRVYNALKDLVNKDQRGFITPAIFNRFASVAQMNVFNGLFDQQRTAVRMRRQQVDSPRDQNKFVQVLEDLSMLTKKETLTLASGVVNKPSDLGRVISMFTVGNLVLGVSNKAQVQIVYNSDDIDLVNLSDISKPTDQNPVALVANQIEVFPNVNTSISSVILRYYKLPQGLVPTTQARSVSQPTFGYSTAVSGVEIYDPALSIDFELPEILFPDLVMEIGSLAGVNLRDSQVVQYSESQITQEAIK